MNAQWTTLLILQVFPVPSIAQGTIELFSDKDAVIGYHYDLNSENTNYNTADWFGALSQPGNLGGENNSRALIYFDLSDIQPGTVIDDATLDLYGIGPVGLGDAASVGNIGANACFLEQIIQTWSDNMVTWNTQPSVTPVNSVPLPQSTPVMQDYIGINVTAMVQAMVDTPSQSFGFMLRTQIEDPTCGLFFCGNGYSDASKRPRLHVKPHDHVAVPEIADHAKLQLSPNPIATSECSWLNLPRQAIGGRIKIMDDNGRLIEDLPISAASGYRMMITPPTGGRFFVTVSDATGRSLGCCEMLAVQP